MEAASLSGPSESELDELMAELNFSFSSEPEKGAAERKAYQAIIAKYLQQLHILDQLPDNRDVLKPKYPRNNDNDQAPYEPKPEENKHNAWYIKTHITGNSSGKLAGKTVAVKDNVALAGVGMMNGSAIMQGYVPDIDAVIVTRLLEAGAVIKGKVHCEDLCFSGGSHTGYQGQVLNPRKPGVAAGGSSSGSAVVVATGEVDMAIGGDQGGSIRIPASFCGVYGMKPTHGLVPYTGIFPIEYTLDHTGPMTNNVQDNALMLEVLAGPDGLDPRQYIPQSVHFNYTDYIGREVKGLKIGLLKEGFEPPGMMSEVAGCVRKAAETIARMGVEVREVSVTEHKMGVMIHAPIITEGAVDQMYMECGMATGHKGFYDTKLVDYFTKQKALHANKAASTVKTALVCGLYANKKFSNHYYSKAQNLARLLTAAYDKALSEVDLLVMPTLPMVATPLPAADAPDDFERDYNLCPFNVSGHPAMSIPCGMVNGLPVGMMIVGKHFDEGRIYQVASAFEKAVQWATQ